MNDPHVHALLYRIEHDNSVDYSKASPIEHEVEPPNVNVKVEDRCVRIELKDHYATEDEARTAVEPFLRYWQIEVALRGRPGQFDLEYLKGEIIDRSPTQGVVIPSALIRHMWDLPQPSVTHTTPKSYPPPPPGLTRNPDDPDVSAMYEHFKRYSENRERLIDMAYFCFTMVTPWLCETKEAAASQYGISGRLLKKIKGLVGRKGARKMTKQGSTPDLNENESQFLEAAIRKLILRVAEVTHNPDERRPKITLSDLPALSDSFGAGPAHAPPGTDHP